MSTSPIRHRLTLLLCSLTFAFVWGCTPPQETSADNDLAWQGVDRAAGHLVLVGGGARPESVMRAILELSDDRSMLIIPMASGIPDTVGWEQRDEFLALGASRVDILMLAAADTLRADLAEQIAAARGIWFSGGDQNRLMDYLGTGVLLDAVREAYRRGAVVAGTSAGTAVMSRTMITGDERFAAQSRDFASMTAGNVITAPGIGLLNNMIVDQHFIFRSRLNRLISVLLDHPEFLAAGIDEATALWVAPDGRAEVLGESQVVLLEQRQPALISRHQAAHPEAFVQGNQSMQLHVLPPGSSFYITNTGFRSIDLGDISAIR